MMHRFVSFSLFSHFSFSMLWGPTNHLKHLINVDRLPFSITYIVTLIGTIYYSVWVSILKNDKSIEISWIQSIMEATYKVRYFPLSVNCVSNISRPSICQTLILLSINLL
jgi:hypothetical protein